jgi:hypothetical protein
MSIDLCQVCDKRIDTDFIEYQDDGTLLCDGCLDEMENEQEPDWKALAGELAEALKAAEMPVLMHRGFGWADRERVIPKIKAALAKYDCSMKEQQEKEKGV